MTWRQPCLAINNEGAGRGDDDGVEIEFHQLRNQFGNLGDQIEHRDEGVPVDLRRAAIAVEQRRGAK